MKNLLVILTISIGLFSASAPNCFAQAAEPPIEYEIDFSQQHRNYLVIRGKTKADSDSTELMMPVWTPGSYLVREFARHIDSFSATDSNGNALPWNKTKKNRWQVSTKDIDYLHFSYRLFANDLSVRTNYVDGEFALINGAATFLTVPRYRQKQHNVLLILPKPWTRSASSLNEGNQEHSFKASTYDELVDSPIVAGNIEIFPFEVAEVPHQLVNVAGSGTWDGSAAASDLKKIVDAHHKLWGVVPYKRYLFINVICGRGGGLEHDNSTVMMTGTWTYRSKDRYTSWLSLASHEFFHTWNVRRLRPKSLVNYDYENELYTPSLWIAEGITSYYEDLLLIRSGLIDKSEYLKRLNSNIDSVQKRPGRLKQSLRESSFDTWIKFYRPSSNSSDTQVSYYSKGAVVGFLLDAEIRKRTAGKQSLDDVMRLMYQRFVEPGYTESDFRNVVAELAGDELKTFFEISVDTPSELDFDAAKQWFGLKFGHDDEPTDTAEESNDEQEPESNDVLDEEEVQTPWLGFDLSGDNIRRIRPDSPAEKAGLNQGDELIAINGFRVQNNLYDHLDQFKAGDNLDLLISRRQKLISLTITVGIEPKSKSWKLKEIKQPSDQQLQNLNEWLGIKTESKKDEKE